VSAALQTPVSVFFYRRPDHLRQVMAKVREARPAILFGISDGSKPRKESIRRGVEESRKVFREMIDWPCQWELLERESNLGSYLSVSGGLDWVFDRVGETIVLEDDTVPDTSFFRFTAELLERYREDPKVGAVCGNNYDDPRDWPGEASYRLTRYHHSWGWGTWKRAWRVFDREEKLLAELPRIRKENWPELSRAEWAYWERCFRRTYAKKLDAWDYRWTLSLWRHHMACVIPRVNLVRNIGFDSQATHTVERDFADLKMHSTEKMKFPIKDSSRNKKTKHLDNLVFKSHYKILEGRRNLFEKLKDKIKNLFKNTSVRSSISDTQAYREACLEAAKKNKVFSTFKQDSRYKEILEHTSYELGRLYLDEIKKSNIIRKNIKKFKVNDKYGKPCVYNYQNIGKYSPSSLRYVKVLADLIERFGSLKGLEVTEIGGGYGGQCLIIQTYFKLKSYKIFDLPEVLQLAERYLQKNNIFSVKMQTLNTFLQSHCNESSKCDLLISNYAFSEISKDVQKTYLERIILHSKRGYMTVNQISNSCGVSSYATDTIVNILKTKGRVTVEAENPLTFEGNKLIWWDWA